MTSPGVVGAVCGPSFPFPGVRLLVVSILLLVAPLLAGCIAHPTDGPGTGPAAPPPTQLLAFYDGLAADPELVLETDHGTIRMLLYQSLMPQTAGRIGALAIDGFYDDTIVHRVVDDFVIQGGDPSDTGLLGSGQTIPFERDPRLRFTEGAVGLARDLDPDSGDAQWFITERPAPHLHDPRGATGDVFGFYSLFGQVFDGMPVVRAIAAEPVLPGVDRPVEDVVVHEAHLLPPPAELDLLGLVRDLDEDTQGRATASRPIHMFAGHPFTVYVYPGEDQPAWGDATIGYQHGGEPLVTVPLAPLPDDPTVWSADVTLPALSVKVENGVQTPVMLKQTVQVDGQVVLATDEVPAHGWHERLRSYAAA